MKKLTDSELYIYESIFAKSPQELHYLMNSFLKNFYDEVVCDAQYTYAIGDIPIMLVAHMDTVFKYPPTREVIFYDSNKNVMWSPFGLGADDRAGILAIITLIKRGYRPYILLTQGEEIGGKGALKFIADYPNPPKALHFLLELDRSGEHDCVFYNCGNKDFIEFITNFGFIEYSGTFTDISIICPQWEIAGANLSVGYIDEHTYSEILFIEFLFNTISKIENILNSETQYFAYMPKKIRGQHKNITSFKCRHCNNPTFIDNIFSVENKQGEKESWCIHCVLEQDALDSICWCEHCGTPMIKISNNDNRSLCTKCSKEFSKEKEEIDVAFGF